MVSASRLADASHQMVSLRLMKLSAKLIFLFSLTQSVLAADFTLRDGALWLGERAVLEHVSSSFTTLKDPTGAGVFLNFATTPDGSLIRSPVGSLPGLRRFTSCRRDEPFWMVPQVGTNLAAVGLETQWLLAETDAGEDVMMVPLMDGAFVFTLSGAA